MTTAVPETLAWTRPPEIGNLRRRAIWIPHPRRDGKILGVRWRERKIRRVVVVFGKTDFLPAESLRLRMASGVEWPAGAAGRARAGVGWEDDDWTNGQWKDADFPSSGRPALDVCRHRREEFQTSAIRNWLSRDLMIRLVGQPLPPSTRLAR